MTQKPSIRKTRGVYEKVVGSGVWWIRYADSTGRIRRETAGSKSQATSLYNKRKTEALQRKKLPESLRSAPLTFAELAKDALEYSRTHKRSAPKDEQRMKLLIEWFGSNPAETLTPQKITAQLQRAKTARCWAPATVNRYKALLSLVFRLALENGRVANNPVRSVRRLQEDNAVIRYLTTEEEDRLRAAIQPKHPERWAAVLFAMETGLRASEQWRLTWSDIDIDAGHPQVCLRLTKNGGIRHVPLNASARSALRAVEHDTQGISGRVFPQQPYRMWFQRAMMTAGIAEFSWHCLRHTFASRLVMSGVDIRTVAELMGHRSLQMTMRYAHLAPEHNALAVAKLDAYRETTSTITDTSLQAITRMPLKRSAQVAVVSAG